MFENWHCPCDIRIGATDEAEQFAFFGRAGAAADRLIDILSDTAGTPTAMKGRGASIAKVLGGEPMGPTAFAVSAAKKDLATAVQFAATIDVELPVAKSALACFEEAEAAGLGEADATTMSVRWAKRSTTKPQS